ncbi:MAG: HupE/UreJ family protein [Leadbetterella sp.]|nr:HupE/UreJ family protein [Leadbetterella sp.]
MKLINTTLLTFFLLLFLGNRQVFAHPMPNSIVLLNVHEKNIFGEIQLPLSELQSAIGNSVNDNSEQLIERLGELLKKYLKDHIKPKTLDGKPWSIELGEMNLVETKSKLSGDYKELVVAFSMAPPINYDLRNFYFDYDVILHNVASHKAIIAIKQDWQQGIVHEDSSVQEVGVIEWDIVNNNLKPFQISLDQGSWWLGFKSMVLLGIKHISEGTDHLMFLFVLILPVPLLIENKKWGKKQSLKISLIKIFKIVTAFTIGHSFSLLFGALNWIVLPTKPIEILIGISILVSAIHAIRPIFPDKETYISLGFGLIHGLAFAFTLQDLSLNTTRMILSILGFNIGIELMQIFIIFITIPLLIIISRSKIYNPFKILGAFIGILAALGWIFERITDKSNFITELINVLVSKPIFILWGLLTLSLVSYFLRGGDSSKPISK